MSRFGCYFPGARKKWLRLVIKGSGSQARIVATPVTVPGDRLKDAQVVSSCTWNVGIMNRHAIHIAHMVVSTIDKAVQCMQDEGVELLENFDWKLYHRCINICL